MLHFVAFLAISQQPGKQQSNKPAPLTMSNCDSSGTCTTSNHAAVLDSNWMWEHKVGSSTNCYTGNTWDPTLCPDPVTCAANCALDAGDYESTYGVSSSGDTLSLKFVQKAQYGTNVGSRTFLMDTDSTYMKFKLKNREFTFTTDVSTLPCGLNGALYFVEMDGDGGMANHPGNKAGAAYGTGYCDAQCPHDIKFINGEANMLKWNNSGNDKNSGNGFYGTCCTEMDIWESNSISQAVTPHTCTTAGQYRCNGTACGDDNADQRDAGVCDKDGGDFAPYRLGDTNFFGPDASHTVDSSKPITVITQFKTTDGTDTGDLSEIRRIYMQDGKVIETNPITIAGQKFDSITDEFIAVQKKWSGDTNTFADRGGLKGMGEALDRGVVLVMSLWADYAVHMLWLDAHFPTSAPQDAPGSNRGSCADDSGNPADLIQNNPDATVKYGDIKFGPIGSTFPSGPSPPSPPGPAPPAGGNHCVDPGSSNPTCNTCAKCCHSFIPAGADCDQCVKENCASKLL